MERYKCIWCEKCDLKNMLCYPETKSKLCINLTYEDITSNNRCDFFVEKK